MTEQPVKQQRSRRRWMLIVVPLLAAVIGATVAAVILLPKTTTRADTPSSTLATTVDTTTTGIPGLDADQQAAQRTVDSAVAMDGIPVDWSKVGGDAYGWVALTCAYLTNYPGGPLAVNWRQTPIPGLMTRGGMEALKVGAPTVCPQLTQYIDTSAAAFFPGI